jgi:hypothetical protein
MKKGESQIALASVPRLRKLVRCIEVMTHITVECSVRCLGTGAGAGGTITSQNQSFDMLRKAQIALF